MSSFVISYDSLELSDLAWRQRSPLDFEVTFDEALALYGIDRRLVAPVLACESDVVLDASDACALPFAIETTSDLDRFKALIGLPNDYVVSGKAIATPLVPDASQLRRASRSTKTLTEEEYYTVKVAAGAYLFGNSAELRGYRSLIERHLAPFTVALYAVERIIVRAGATLCVQGPPSVVVAREVIVEHGASLKLKTVSQVVTDMFTRDAASVPFAQEVEM